MSNISKSSSEKKKRAKIVWDLGGDSGRDSRQDSGLDSGRESGRDSRQDSGRSPKKAKLTSSSPSKGTKNVDKKSPSKHDKYESSSRRRQEKDSDRKMNRKRAYSPANSDSGSTSPNAKKSSEVVSRNKETRALKDLKQEVKENEFKKERKEICYGTNRGDNNKHASKFRSNGDRTHHSFQRHQAPGRRYNEDSNRKKEGNRTHSPANAMTGSRPSNFKKENEPKKDFHSGTNRGHSKERSSEHRHSSARRHETSDRKDRKRTPSPANAKAGSSSSNFKKSSEVFHKNKESSALKDLKLERKENGSKKELLSGSDRGRSKEHSSGRRYEKDSDRKERKRTPSPANSKTGSTPSNYKKSSEATRKEKEPNTEVPKQERKENNIKKEILSGTDQGHSKERSSGRRYEKDSDRKERKRTPSPTNLKTGMRPSNYKKSIEATRKEKKPNTEVPKKERKENNIKKEFLSGSDRGRIKEHSSEHPHSSARRHEEDSDHKERKRSHFQVILKNKESDTTKDMKQERKEKESKKDLLSGTDRGLSKENSSEHRHSSAHRHEKDSDHKECKRLHAPDNSETGSSLSNPKKSSEATRKDKESTAEDLKQERKEKESKKELHSGSDRGHNKERSSGHRHETSDRKELNRTHAPVNVKTGSTLSNSKKSSEIIYKNKESNTTENLKQECKANGTKREPKERTSGTDCGNEKKQSSERHYEKDSVRKEHKLTHAPANSETGSTSSNSKKSSEVIHKNKESTILKDMNQERMEKESKKELLSGTVRGHSKDQSSERRLEKDSDRKEHKLMHAPVHSKTGSISATSEKAREVVRENKVSNANEDLKQKPKENDTKKELFSGTDIGQSKEHSSEHPHEKPSDRKEIKRVHSLANSQTGSTPSNLEKSREAVSENKEFNANKDLKQKIKENDTKKEQKDRSSGRRHEMDSDRNNEQNLAPANSETGSTSSNAKKSSETTRKNNESNAIENPNKENDTKTELLSGTDLGHSKEQSSEHDYEKHLDQKELKRAHSTANSVTASAPLNLEKSREIVSEKNESVALEDLNQTPKESTAFKDLKLENKEIESKKELLSGTDREHSEDQSSELKLAHSPALSGSDNKAPDVNEDLKQNLKENDTKKEQKDRSSGRRHEMDSDRKNEQNLAPANSETDSSPSNFEKSNETTCKNNESNAIEDLRQESKENESKKELLSGSDCGHSSERRHEKDSDRKNEQKLAPANSETGSTSVNSKKAREVVSGNKESSALENLNQTREETDTKKEPKEHSSGLCHENDSDRKNEQILAPANSVTGSTPPNLEKSGRCHEKDSERKTSRRRCLPLLFQVVSENKVSNVNENLNQKHKENEREKELLSETDLGQSKEYSSEHRHGPENSENKESNANEDLNESKKELLSGADLGHSKDLSFELKLTHAPANSETVSTPSNAKNSSETTCKNNESNDIENQKKESNENNTKKELLSGTDIGQSKEHSSGHRHERDSDQKKVLKRAPSPANSVTGSTPSKSKKTKEVVSENKKSGALEDLNQTPKESTAFKDLQLENKKIEPKKELLSGTDRGHSEDQSSELKLAHSPALSGSDNKESDVNEDLKQKIKENNTKKEPKRRSSGRRHKKDSDGDNEQNLAPANSVTGSTPSKFEKSKEVVSENKELSALEDLNQQRKDTELEKELLLGTDLGQGKEHSSEHRHEKPSDRKELKRAHSPANSVTGSIPSNLEKSKEVVSDNKKSSALEELNQKRKENELEKELFSGTDLGNSKEPSSKHCHEKPFDRNNEQECELSPSNLESVSSLSNFENAGEVASENKESGVLEDLNQTPKESDTTKDLKQKDKENESKKELLSGTDCGHSEDQSSELKLAHSPALSGSDNKAPDVNEDLKQKLKENDTKKEPKKRSPRRLHKKDSDDDNEQNLAPANSVNGSTPSKSKKAKEVVSENKESSAVEDLNQQRTDNELEKELLSETDLGQGKEQSSEHRHEKPSERKELKRAHSPANSQTGSTSSNSKKAKEVVNENKEPDANKDLKQKIKENVNKKEPKKRSPRRLHKKDSDGDNEQNLAPANSVTGSTPSNFEKSSEVVSDHKDLSTLKDLNQKSTENELEKDLFLETDLGNSKEPSTGNRHKKGSDQKKDRKRARSPANSETGSTPPNSKKARKDLNQKLEEDESKKKQKEDSSGTDCGAVKKVSPKRRVTSPASPLPRKKAVVVKDSKEVSSLDDLKPAFVTRQVLFDLLYAPFFDWTVVGCYVSLMGKAIGNPSQNSIWRVIGVEELNAPYDIYRKLTNKYILCKRGLEERLLRMKFVSTSEIQQDEFAEWLLCTQSSGNMPTLDEIEKKKGEIQRALSHKYADKEVDMFIQARKKYAGGISPILKKANLLKQLDLALKTGDYQDASRIQERIDKLHRSFDTETTPDLTTLVKQSSVTRNQAEPVAVKEVSPVSEPTVDSDAVVDLDWNYGMDVNVETESSEASAGTSGGDSNPIDLSTEPTTSSHE